jgi:hypothetical protein
LKSELDITNLLDETHLRYLNKEEAEKTALAHNMTNTTQICDPNYPSPSNNLNYYFGDVILDDITLDDIFKHYDPQMTKDDSIEFLFLLCNEKAPLKLKNEITIKCIYPCQRNQEELRSELTINLSNTIRELTNGLVQKMKLKPIELEGDTNECYYLKTIDWLGDVEGVLNDLDQTCADANLKHNQLLHIDRGTLVLPNHIKIKLWISYVYLKSGIK